MGDHSTVKNGKVDKSVGRRVPRKAMGKAMRKLFWQLFALGIPIWVNYVILPTYFKVLNMAVR